LCMHAKIVLVKGSCVARLGIQNDKFCGHFSM
jgi:hypothetical protein